MSLKGKYSPPYTVTMIDGETTLAFKRMLGQEWEELSEQVKAKRIEAENAKINVEMKDAPANDRAIVRSRMRDFFEDEITMSRVIRESANTAKGIRQLLAYALVDKTQAEWLEIIGPADANAIVDQIVAMPTVKPADPALLPPQNEVSGGGSESDTLNPIGPGSPATSNLPSTDTTQAS